MCAARATVLCILGDGEEDDESDEEVGDEEGCEEVNEINEDDGEDDEEEITEWTYSPIAFPYRRSDGDERVLKWFNHLFIH